MKSEEENDSWKDSGIFGVKDSSLLWEEKGTEDAKRKSWVLYLPSPYLGNYFWLKAFDRITILILDHEHLGFLLVIFWETCDGFWT